MLPHSRLPPWEMWTCFRPLPFPHLPPHFFQFVLAYFWVTYRPNMLPQIRLCSSLTISKLFYFLRFILTLKIPCSRSHRRRSPSSDYSSDSSSDRSVVVRGVTDVRTDPLRIRLGVDLGPVPHRHTLISELVAMALEISGFHFLFPLRLHRVHHLLWLYPLVIDFLIFCPALSVSHSLLLSAHLLRMCLSHPLIRLLVFMLQEEYFRFAAAIERAMCYHGTRGIASGGIQFCLQCFSV